MSWLLHIARVCLGCYSNYSDYTTDGNLIGSGRYASVFFGKELSTGMQCVIKQLKKPLLWKLKRCAYNRSQ